MVLYTVQSTLNSVLTTNFISKYYWYRYGIASVLFTNTDTTKNTDIYRYRSPISIKNQMKFRTRSSISGKEKLRTNSGLAPLFWVPRGPHQGRHVSNDLSTFEAHYREGASFFRAVRLLNMGYKYFFK